MISETSHRTTGARTLRDQSQRVLEDVKELGSIAADDVSDGTERLKARGKELFSDGRARIRRYQGQARKYIAVNPWKSLLMAFGVGALVGLVLRRRSS